MCTQWGGNAKGSPPSATTIGGYRPCVAECRPGGIIVRDRRSTRQQLIAGDGPLAKVPPVAAFALVIALLLIAILVRGILGGVLLGLVALVVAALLAGTS